MKIKTGVKPSLPPVPGGTYLAVCVYSIAIGEQLCDFKDKGKSYNNQVMLGFELSGVEIEIDGKKEPRTLGRTFNIAKSKNSALRKFVGAWQAKEYSDEEFLELDTNDLVGKAAMLNVVLNESGEYSNIESVMQIPVGFPQPQATLPLIRFDMEPWDQAAFEALPEWAQMRIRKSTQWQKEHAPRDTIQAPGAAAAMQMPGRESQGAPAMAGVPGNPGGFAVPLPPLRGTFPPGEGIGGAFGGVEVPAGIPQSAPLTAPFDKGASGTMWASSPTSGIGSAGGGTGGAPF